MVVDSPTNKLRRRDMIATQQHAPITSRRGTAPTHAPLPVAGSAFNEGRSAKKSCVMGVMNEQKYYASRPLFHSLPPLSHLHVDPDDRVLLQSRLVPLERGRVERGVEEELPRQPVPVRALFCGRLDWCFVWMVGGPRRTGGKGDRPFIGSSPYLLGHEAQDDLQCEEKVPVRFWRRVCVCRSCEPER